VFFDPVEESQYLKFLMREKYKIFEDNKENEKRIHVLNSISCLINNWQIEFSTRMKKIS
jgi:hypothetical protein